jgi:hypothetical protein
MRRNFLIGKAVRLRRKIRKIAYGIVPIKAAAERKLAAAEVCDASFDDHMYQWGLERGRKYLI